MDKIIDNSLLHEACRGNDSSFGVDFDHFGSAWLEVWLEASLGGNPFALARHHLDTVRDWADTAIGELGN